MTNINHQHFETRKKLWMALSEFYLDTELQEYDYNSIADIFIKSGLSVNEIKKTDLFEVFPLLQPNLLSTAGAWAGFEEDWLVQSCEKRYQRRKNIFHRLNCRFWNMFFYRMSRDHWKAVEKRMDQGK